MFKFCKTEIEGIEFIYISKETMVGVQVFYVFSVTTTLLATKLYQGLIVIGIWHTKLKFIFSKVVTCHLNKSAATKMVQYYKQNNSINNISCTNISKIIFGSNDT